MSMLIKIHHQNTKTCWLKDDFRQAEINEINELINAEMSKILFSPKLEGYYCKSQKEYNKIIKIISSYSKSLNS